MANRQDYEGSGILFAASCIGGNKNCMGRDSGRLLTETIILRWTVIAAAIVHLILLSVIAIIVIPPTLKLMEESSAAVLQIHQTVADARVPEIVARVDRMSAMADTLMGNATKQLAFLPNMTTKAFALATKVMAQGETLSDMLTESDIYSTLLFIQERNVLQNSALVLDVSASILRNNVFNVTAVVEKLSHVIDTLTNLTKTLETNGLTLKI